MVVFPATTQDVGYIVQATYLTPLWNDFAFACGAHSLANASSLNSMIIDLSYLNKSWIIPDFVKSDGNKVHFVAYQGGSKWAQVQATTSGSGYTTVGVRISSAGVGGFSTGGGIGFLAGAHGYASYRFVVLNVILPNGDIVNATK